MPLVYWTTLLLTLAVAVTLRRFAARSAGRRWPALGLFFRVDFILMVVFVALAFSAFTAPTSMSSA